MIEATSKPPRRNERRRARDQKRWPAKQKAHHQGKVAGFKMNSQEQSTEANSKAKPMIARVVVCNNGRKPKGPVRKNTCYQAFATPTDKRGFVVPKFLSRLNFEPVDQCPNSDIGMVCGRGGVYPQGRPHGLVHVLNHHAHQQRVRTLRVVSSSVHQGTKAMQLATTALRHSAHPAHGHTFHAHAGNTFNRDVIAIGNAENALQRVMYELKKVNPDMARAQKLTLAAMAAVQYVGVEVLQ